MKYLLLILISFALSVALRAQDVITTKNGTRFNGKIVREDSVKVEFTMQRNGNTIRSYLNKSDIESIEYAPDRTAEERRAYREDIIVMTDGNMIRCKILSESNEKITYAYLKKDVVLTDSIEDKKVHRVIYGNTPIEDEVSGTHITTFGFGVGRDYGGIGLNLTVYFNHALGFFGGAGYALAGIGLNGGLKIKLASAQSKSHVIPFLTGMYGYNTAVVVKNASQYNKLFNGLTFGGGLDIYTRHYRGMFVLALLVPVVDPEADAYVKSLSRNSNIRFDNGVPKVGFSLGYRFATQ
jgi:hypothetical protein